MRGVSACRADVVVLGAGLAGLSASLAFAKSGRRVLLLERDGPAVDGGADRLFECWERPGISHFRQPHNFLALARQVLLEQTPEVLDRVFALGALENRQYELLPGEPTPSDEALVSICARRPVFESALREAVETHTNVEVETKMRMVGILGDGPGGDGSVRVKGVRIDGGKEIQSELVIDALGRTSPLGQWLEELGARPMFERRSECGLLYYSRHFRFRDGVEMPRLPSLLRGPAARSATWPSRSSSRTIARSSQS